MSLAHLDSQIDDLRSKAAGIQKRGTSVRDSLTEDRALSDVAKREKLDKEREHSKAQLSDL